MSATTLSDKWNLYDKNARNKVNVDHAVQEANNQDLYIISPACNASEEELDKQWDRYNSMTKPFRRRADWITLEYFGMTNIDMYEVLKSKWLRTQVAPLEIDGVITTGADMLKEDAVETFTAASDTVDVGQVLSAVDMDVANELAKNFYLNTGMIIISPVFIHNQNDIDKLWDAYNMMLLKHRRKSDWMCLELYGVTNMQMYKYIKSNMLKDMKDLPETEEEEDRYAFYEFSAIRNYYKKIIHEEDITANEIAAGLANLLFLNESYDRIIGGNIISDVIQDYEGLTQAIADDKFSVSDMPAYTPDEMIDMGVFGGMPEENMFGVVVSEEKTKDWFESYCAYQKTGVISDEFVQQNIDRIHRLEELYSKDLSDPAVKQNILENGWNPNIPFNPRNRAIADRRMNSIISEISSSKSTIINIASDKISAAAVNINNEIKKDLKPIYIVLEEGTRLFSYAIKGFTSGIYSHAMICFDHMLERMYSFGYDGSVNKYRGGFTIESIKEKPKDAHIKVYTIFVSNPVYNAIKDKVQWFIDHQRETHYNWSNIFKFVFNVPSENKDDSMICSQFVDSILKMVGIDFTKSPSSLIAPNTIDRKAKNSKRIYTVYSDQIKKYNPATVLRRVQKLLTTAKPIKESYKLAKNNLLVNTIIALESEQEELLYALSESANNSSSALKSIYETFITPQLEAKEFPVEIENNGDAIIHMIKPSDYEAAYAKSHKLLMQYSKAGNYDGIKTELARLWFMNNSIEQKIHSKAFPPSKQKVNELNKAKAKIMNDFNTYMNFVLTHDPKFNFSEYYEDSPYSDTKLKVHGSTIRNAVRTVLNLL